MRYGILEVQLFIEQFDLLVRLRSFESVGLLFPLGVIESIYPAFHRRICSGSLFFYFFIHLFHKVWNWTFLFLFFWVFSGLIFSCLFFDFFKSLFIFIMVSSSFLWAVFALGATVSSAPTYPFSSGAAQPAEKQVISEYFDMLGQKVQAGRKMSKAPVCNLNNAVQPVLCMLLFIFYSIV